jgi:peptidoglycan/LPS O-acetylase OafA/YrhL
MRHNEPVVLYHHSFSAAFDIALGGLAAWIMYFSATAKTFIVSLSRNIILTVYIVFLGVILFQDYIFGLNQLTISLFLFQLFAAFIIIEQNYASHSFFKIGDNKWISTLGKCAYGFFCYHIICIRVTEGLAIKYGVYGSLGEVVVIPILSFLVTILTGWVSYHLFESPFLKLKSKFSYLK